MPASCGSYRLTRLSLESKSHPPGASARRSRRVVTGSRGLPSALPAHLPPDACGLRRYEPVGTEWIAPLRGKLLTYPTRNFADRLARSGDRVSSRPWGPLLHVAMQMGPSLHPK